MNLKGIDRDRLVAAVVAGSAFLVSGQHIYHVTERAGNPEIIAAVHPLALDGLLYVAIRAIQRGQRGWGVAAMIYGAAFSAWFNAASYGAVPMPHLALALCIPMAFVLATIIVHGAGHAEPAAPEVVERVVEKIVTTPRELLPIAPLELVREHRPEPIRVASIPRPELSNRPTSGGPVVQWDVAKTVDMVLDNQADEDIMSVTSVSKKNLQRVRRVVRGLSADETLDNLVRGDVTLALAGRVQVAYMKAMES